MTKKLSRVCFRHRLTTSGLEAEVVGDIIMDEVDAVNANMVRIGERFEFDFVRRLVQTLIFACCRTVAPYREGIPS